MTTIYDIAKAAGVVMAFGVMAVVWELGLRIPQDLSIVGSDDISLSAYTLPPLTTVRFDSALLMEKTLRTFYNRLMVGMSLSGTLMSISCWPCFEPFCLSTLRNQLRKRISILLMLMIPLSREIYMLIRHSLFLLHTNVSHAYRKNRLRLANTFSYINRYYESYNIFSRFSKFSFQLLTTISSVC